MGFQEDRPVLIQVAPICGLFLLVLYGLYKVLQIGVRPKDLPPGQLICFLRETYR